MKSCSPTDGGTETEDSTDSEDPTHPTSYTDLTDVRGSRHRHSTSLVTGMPSCHERSQVEIHVGFRMCRTSELVESASVLYGEQL
jgi:hypothetical protein